MFEKDQCKEFRISRASTVVDRRYNEFRISRASTVMDRRYNEFRISRASTVVDRRYKATQRHRPRHAACTLDCVRYLAAHHIAFSMSRIPWQQILSFTPADLVKLLLSAAIIVIVNKVQLFSDRLSALLIALPLTSLLAMIWMHQGGQSGQRIANHAEGTFWFVLPTLPMFLILPWMIRAGWGFWPALMANCVLTTGFFWLTVVILRRFGIDLMPG